jgi:hypothetical protein
VRARACAAGGPLWDAGGQGWVGAARGPGRCAIRGPASSWHARRPAAVARLLTRRPDPTPPQPRRDWGPALGPAGVFSSIYLLAAAGPGAGTQRRPAAPDSGSHLQAAHLRQLHHGDRVRVTAHAVVVRPATGAVGPVAVSGAARLEVPELGVDVSKAFQWADVSNDACRTASDAPGARVECDILVEVRRRAAAGRSRRPRPRRGLAGTDGRCAARPLWAGARPCPTAAEPRPSRRPLGGC